MSKPSSNIASSSEPETLNINEKVSEMIRFLELMSGEKTSKDHLDKVKKSYDDNQGNAIYELYTSSDEAVNIFEVQENILYRRKDGASTALVTLAEHQTDNHHKYFKELYEIFTKIENNKIFDERLKFIMKVCGNEGLEIKGSNGIELNITAKETQPGRYLISMISGSANSQLGFFKLTGTDHYVFGIDEPKCKQIVQDLEEEINKRLGSFKAISPALNKKYQEDCNFLSDDSSKVPKAFITGNPDENGVKKVEFNLDGGRYYYYIDAQGDKTHFKNSEHELIDPVQVMTDLCAHADQLKIDKFKVNFEYLDKNLDGISKDETNFDIHKIAIGGKELCLDLSKKTAILDGQVVDFMRAISRTNEFTQGIKKSPEVQFQETSDLIDSFIEVSKMPEAKGKLSISALNSALNEDGFETKYEMKVNGGQCTFTRNSSTKEFGEFFINDIKRQTISLHLILKELKSSQFKDLFVENQASKKRGYDEIGSSDPEIFVDGGFSDGGHQSSSSEKPPHSSISTTQEVSQLTQGNAQGKDLGGERWS